MPGRLRVLAAVAAAGLLAACTQVVAAPPPVAAPAPDLSGYYAQQLTWEPCADETGKAYECSWLEVPLDYARPDGQRAGIALLKTKAAGARIGSLVINPGGPGGSGTEAAAALATRLDGKGVAERFDIVGFDPRGVGASTPTLDCLDDAEWEVERADLDLDPSPAGVDAAEAENRTYAQRCAERSGGVEVLANAGTRDVARDLDVLRAALGDRQLTFLGYSYGTRIGAAYAEAFPQNVRALVLDGAVDPTRPIVDTAVAQSAGFQQAFDAYAADCARRKLCPLGRDPEQAVERFQGIVRPLIDRPVSAGDGRTLTYPDAITGVVQGLYVSQLWPAITIGLVEVAAGQGTVLLQLADTYNGRGPDGRYSNMLEAFTAINCVDDERITDRAVQEDLLRRVTAASPFRDSGRPIVPALDPCAFWPVPPTSTPHVPQVTGLPPTLTISVTGDPATPYQAGVDLAAALGGRLLSVEGNQHTIALQGNTCVDDAVAAYLVELRLPDEHARCTL